MSRNEETRVPPIYDGYDFTGSIHWDARKTQFERSIGNSNYQANSSNVEMHYPAYDFMHYYNSICYADPPEISPQFINSHLYRRLQSRPIRRRNRLEENASILNRRFHESLQVTVPIRNPEHSPRVSRDLPRINDLGALPNGLEMRHTSDGREYYVDQNNVPLLTSSTVVQNMLKSRRNELEFLQETPSNITGFSGINSNNLPAVTNPGNGPRVPRDLENINYLSILPNGLEMRHTSDGREYYVDHNNVPHLSSSSAIQIMLNFNRIYIPPYETDEKLYEELTQAIEETCGFAIE